MRQAFDVNLLNDRDEGEGYGARQLMGGSFVKYLLGMMSRLVDFCSDGFLYIHIVSFFKSRH